jgi:enoyl ACP reductase
MFETAPMPDFAMGSGRLLEGKRLLITGVITNRSIAFAVAKRAQEQGAEILLTGFGRARRLTERAAKRLEQPVDVVELDVNEPGDLELLRIELNERWGRLDGVLHAIAFAPEDALGGQFLETPAESAELAFRTSAFSMKALAAAVAPLMESGSAIVGLDFDASVAWPVYDWMGVSKAALESVNRYLCRDLGPRGIRSNLVSAGPIETAAASGIAGFSRLAGLWGSRAPLGWDPGDPGPVADAVCFLLSDASRGISGQILRVDGGFSAIGTELPEADAEAAAE